MAELDVSSFVADFQAEAREHLDALERGLLTLESSPDTESRMASIRALFRSAHTIKGSARMMGFEQVAQVTHALEDVLGELREGRLTITPEATDDLLRAVDFIRQQIERPPDDAEGVSEMTTRLRAILAPRDVIEVPEGAQASDHKAGAPDFKAEMAEDTVRLPVGRLDDLLRLTGELRSAGQRIQALDVQSQIIAADAQTCLRAMRGGDAEKFRTSAVNLGERLQGWRAEHNDSERVLASAIERLEQEVIALRLLPVSTVFASLPRLVRDLAREHEKLVDLTISGETTELDRRILQGLGEPLLHLVRNAIDHGIEPSAERARLGKPAAGQVVMRAYRQGKQVRVELSDDGRGMNPPALREAAVRKKLLTAEAAAALDDEAALQLIFLPGFSTSTFITSTSGRGVGMEIVKESIDRLGGSIEMWTQPGQGTRFTLVLPLTLTLAQVLFVAIDGKEYALPTGAIERIILLTPETIQSGGGRENVIFENKPIPLFRLGRLFGLSGSESNTCPTLILSIANQRTAFAVERVIDEREVVLKPLGQLLSRSELASGATVLPDGQVALVLDPAGCLRAARSGPRRIAREVAAEERPRYRILVVEDAYTTRELERSILAASGYEVDTAADGAEGWRSVQAGGIDLVVTDVEMPNMNGFELTQAIRGDERFAALPVVIVTGREQESERRRGLAVGAQAYLVKSAFDQAELLDTIERLLP